MNSSLINAYIGQLHVGKIINLLEQNIHVWSIDDIHYIYKKCSHIKSIVLYMENHYTRSDIIKQHKKQLVYQQLRMVRRKNVIQLFKEKMFVAKYPETIANSTRTESDVKMYHMSNVILKLYPDDIEYRLYNLLQYNFGDIFIIKYISHDAVNNLFYESNIVGNTMRFLCETPYTTENPIDWYEVMRHLTSDYMMLRYINLYKYNYITAVLDFALQGNKYNEVEYIINNRNLPYFDNIIIRYSTFMHICRHGIFPIIKLFIDNDLHNLFEKSSHKTMTRKMYIWKCFMYACQHNRKDVVEYMLNTNTSCYSLCSGKLTILNIACLNNSIDVVEILLDENRIDSYPQTTFSTIIIGCISMVCKSGNSKILKLLLADHVQRTISDIHVSQCIQRHMIEIERRGNTDIMDYLMTYEIKNRYDL